MTIELQNKLAQAIKTRDAAIQRIANLEAEIQVASKLESVQAGTSIVARLGRAGSNGEPGTLREVPATVVAVQDTEAGRRYKVSYGEGFDTDVVVIQTSQIVQIN